MILIEVKKVILKLSKGGRWAEVLLYLVKEANKDSQVIELIREVISKVEKEEDTIQNLVCREKVIYAQLIDFIIEQIDAIK